jgi:DNA-binding CsgD family transcriptional regulator
MALASVAGTALSLLTCGDTIAAVRDGAAGHLLERERELASITTLIDRAAAGRGGLLVVEGQAGAGKTQLLSAAREQATRAGLAELAARGGVLDSGHAYGVTRALLGPLVAGRTANGEAFGEVAGAAMSLFDPAAPPAPGHPGEPSFSVLAALCEIVLATARQTPLLLCVDDAHWVDPETLRFLTSLASRAPEEPLLLLIGAREREPGGARELLTLLAGDPGATVLRPAPLSEHAIASLLAVELRARAEEQFIAAFAHATGGNPFLCSELARTLASERVTPSAVNAAQVSAYAPPGVSRAVLARLALLTSEARSVACALAVLGGEGDWSVLAQLAGLDAERLAAAIDLLSDAGVVAPAATPTFRHPLIRTVIYEDTPLAQRDRVHRQAARLMADQEDIAAHLLLTRPSGDAWAAERLGEAAERALAQGAAEAACRYLHRAVAEPPAAHRAGPLLARLGEAESRRGDPNAAVSALERALPTTEDPAVRGELVVALSLALVRANRPREAMTVLEEALAALPGEEVELGRKMETELEVIAHLNGLAGRGVNGRPLRFARSTGKEAGTHGERLALAGRADIEMNQGQAQEAGRLALLALGDGALLRDEGAAGVLFFSTAIALLYCDHLEAAERAYTDALGYGREAGLPGMEKAAQGFLAGVHYRRGSLERAESCARDALPPVRVTEAPIHATFAGAFLINALVDRGELGRASRVLEELGAGGPLPDALITNILQHARGRLRSASGDHRAALADHLDCARRAGEWAMHTPAVENWRSLAALELSALGRLEEANEHAAAGTRAARDFGSPRALGSALTIEGTVRGEISLLEEAVAALEHTEALLTRAQALVALGAAQRRSGRRAYGRETLAAGLRLARVCGAVPLAREADAELTVAGSRARRILRSGTDQLTASERRVAELAADGYSNQQIADTLTISIRTAEAHLAHTYQKLEIAGRHELAAALGRGPTGDAVLAERRG